MDHLDSAAWMALYVVGTILLFTLLLRSRKSNSYCFPIFRRVILLLVEKQKILQNWKNWQLDQKKFIVLLGCYTKFANCIYLSYFFTFIYLSIYVYIDWQGVKLFPLSF